MLSRPTWKRIPDVGVLALLGMLALLAATAVAEVLADSLARAIGPGAMCLLFIAALVEQFQFMRRYRRAGKTPR